MRPSQLQTEDVSPRKVRFESAEGKVLFVDDAELVKRLTDVDEVESTESMGENVLTGAQRSGVPGSPALAICAPFSPGEGAGQSRGQLVSANLAILNDYWDSRLSSESHFVELLRARSPAGAHRGPYSYS
jgi:hypothetical protein